MTSWCAVPLSQTGVHLCIGQTTGTPPRDLSARLKLSPQICLPGHYRTGVAAGAGHVTAARTVRPAGGGTGRVGYCVRTSCRVPQPRRWRGERWAVGPLSSLPGGGDGGGGGGGGGRLLGGKSKQTGEGGRGRAAVSDGAVSVRGGGGGTQACFQARSGVGGLHCAARSRHGAERSLTKPCALRPAPGNSTPPRHPSNHDPLPAAHLRRQNTSRPALLPPALRRVTGHGRCSPCLSPAAPPPSPRRARRWHQQTDRLSQPARRRAAEDLPPTGDKETHHSPPPGPVDFYFPAVGTGN